MAMQVNDNEMWAHTPNKEGLPHYLKDHLQAVAMLAVERAEPFGGGPLVKWLSVLHDLGKANPGFQDYLRAAAEGRKTSSVPHAIWGAAVAFKWGTQQNTEAWKELSLPILGHHAGLHDAGHAAQLLSDFLSRQGSELTCVADLLRELAKDLPKPQIPQLPPRERECLIRMIFSALVDADYLDTDRHFDSAKTIVRSAWPSLDELWEKCERAQKELIAGADSTPVNRVRRQVYEACLQAATKPPGVFRLTVPTGGGKTRSALAFALRHTISNGLRRIVVAIPYTSIIDQTADEYRKILGNEAILEHHSAIEISLDETYNEQALRVRLATENWDSPLIVTTTVQLFESLFSNRPSRARKLHNVARSLVLLDEVQTLPPELLAPTLDMLRTLVERYGVTIVLSTATQPAFEEGRLLESFKGMNVEEIVPNYAEHFTALRRVFYEYRSDAVSWSDLARDFVRLPAGLVILNTRKDALALLDALGDAENIFHLSTLLCAAHRRRVLAEVKRRLKERLPVRLVSTQVVEAGVDLDFPVVFRAVGPLDRIVQAAGRCNREGLSPQLGQVIIFQPADGGIPRGPYRVGMEKARLLLEKYSPSALHEPDLYREYFRRLFEDVDIDKKNIQAYRECLNYPEVSHRYRLVEAETLPVIVRFEAAEERLAAWQANPCRQSWQRLQPYMVGISHWEFRSLHKKGWLEAISDGIYRWCGRYDDVRGLAEARMDPADLII
jgi:CRISPR-associated endonuclease/helicase Cas3